MDIVSIMKLPMKYTYCYQSEYITSHRPDIQIIYPMLYFFIAFVISL